MTQAYSSDVTTDGGQGARGTGDASRPGRGGRYGGRFSWRREGMWRRGIITAVCAVLLTLLLVMHSSVPNRIGNLGSLLETFLPWAGLAIPVLLLIGLLRRSATALIAVLLPIAVWLNLFGGLVTDKSAGGGNLTVLTHNVNAQNADPAATAKDVIAAGCRCRRAGGTGRGSGLHVREPAQERLPVPLRQGHRRALEQVPDQRRQGG